MKKNMDALFQCTYKSPIGYLQLKSSIYGLESIYFSDERINENINDHLLKAIDELDGYFAGTLRQFKTPLHLKGTAFQNQVWQKLRNIPFAETLSYKTLAIELQNEKAIRAVAAANGKNPIAIMIPCHRIIGSNQKMIGYAWGVEKKLWLLDFEKKHAGIGQQSLF